MKLLFKQRLFSWFDSYDVYYESGEVAYTVKGKMSLGHLLHILDANGNHVATVEQRLLSFLAKYDLFIGGNAFSTLCREFTFFKAKYRFEGGPDWELKGDWLGWDYSLTHRDGTPVATISKELWNWTDTYSIDVPDPQNALPVLMAVIAIDADNCSRND